MEEFTCLTCFSVSYAAKNSANCPAHRVCHSCTFEWALELVKSHSLAREISIRCQKSDCSSTQPIESVLQAFHEQKQTSSFEGAPFSRYCEELEEQLLKHYLRLESDIRSCPNSQCSYQGFIEFEYCSRPLTCQACLCQWTDPLINKFTLKKVSLELVSNLTKSLYYQVCPNCGIYVQKVEGCSHMTCSICHYQYCWECSSAYLSPQCRKYCSIRSSMLSLSLNLVITLLLLRLQVPFYCWSVFQWVILKFWAIWQWLFQTVFYYPLWLLFLFSLCSMSSSLWEEGQHLIKQIQFNRSARNYDQFYVFAFKKGTRIVVLWTLNYSFDSQLLTCLMYGHTFIASALLAVGALFHLHSLALLLLCNRPLPSHVMMPAQEE